MLSLDLDSRVLARALRSFLREVSQNFIAKAVLSPVERRDRKQNGPDSFRVLPLIFKCSRAGAYEIISVFVLSGGLLG